MKPQDFYERQCESLDRELEAGRLSRAEYLEQVRERRRELQAEIEDESRRAYDDGFYRDS